MHTPAIHVVVNETDIRRCYPVMAQLRPHLAEQTFVERTLRQMRDERFRIAALEVNGQVEALAGFRIMETLITGVHMYVDDLVTAERSRSMGYGGQLFEWLVSHAHKERCVELHLDSGVQRHDAHRFYFRQGMCIMGYHFKLKL